MFRLLILVALQSLLFTGGQVLLKLATAALPDKFEWTWRYFKILLTDWWLLACGISFGAGTVLWLHILKHYPFSQAYPLTALGYVFGMLAGIWIFGEQVPLARWFGMALIILGCFLIMR